MYKMEAIQARDAFASRAEHAEHHVRKLNKLNMHKELDLTIDETLNASMRIGLSSGSVIGLATIEYSTNYGKGLRRILGSERYVPEGLNIDVWSHAVGYLGISLGVTVSLSVYFTSVLDYWEPIWVVKGVTYNCRWDTVRTRPSLQPKASS